MRRAIVTAVATVVGVIALLHFKTSPTPVRLGTTGVPPTGSGDTASPAAGASPQPGASPQADASPQAAGTSKTIKGPDVPNRFGDVQVQITVSGGKLTDVQALTLPSDRARSAAISQYVAPVLSSEALQAQSAQIDSISGATYTSDSYAQSLQAALTQAGL